MASQLDILITPIARRDGKDRPDLPGLVLAHPPRKAARGRMNDRLVLYLELSGSIEPGKIETATLIQTMATTFYANPGALSSTMRLIAEDLNNFLLSHNKKNNSYEKRVTAALTQVVLRPDSFYMAQSGLVHAFFVNSAGVLHLFDPMFTGQGLGSAQSTAVRFYQGQFEAGDLLLLSSNPSPLWTETSLSVFHGRDKESLRKRLFDQGMMDISAVLFQARAGDGRIQVVPFLMPVAVDTPVTDDQDIIASPGSQLQEQLSTSTGEAVAGEESVPLPQPPQKEEGLVQPEKQAASQFPGETQKTVDQVKPGAGDQNEPETTDKQTVSQTDDTQKTTPVIPAQPVEPADRQPARSKNRLVLALVSIGEALSSFFKMIGRFFGRFFGRLFPDELLELSNTAMAMVAIFVPVLVVAGASLLYYQLGRAEQGRLLYLQAGEITAHALQLEQPLEKRGELFIAWDTLDQSESYGGVPEAQLTELRFRLQSEIDLLDNVRRIDFQPAIIDGLDESARITRMLVSFDDLYLLDSSTGSVLRTFRTTQGYQLDDNFQCGPQFATGSIGPLVGMALWEGFEPDAAIMSVDQAGNILFCRPGSQPILEKLAPPSTGALRSISAITINRSLLYILDPPGNAVWVYSISELDNEPSFFFGDQHPPVQDALDLAVNFDELYLLHKDGHLTLCYAFLKDISFPKCNDPQPFTDFRVGRENATYIPETPFSQLFANPSPDPSLYLLEPTNQSVTHFSFRTLGFLRAYAPLQPLPGGDATAFAISGVDRLLFLATGDRVYFGIMP